MSDKIRHFLSTALCIALVFVSSSAFAGSNGDLKCSELLSGKSFSIWNPVLSFTENRAALVSRLKPVYKNSHFDVRILSSAMSKNTFSPAKLLDATVQALNHMISSYTQMGFSFSSFLQVLVEAHPNAIGHIKRNDDGQLRWIDIENQTPWVSDGDGDIGVPDFFGDRVFFDSRPQILGFKKLPSILALTAISPTFHSLDNEFILAHELAHQTETSLSHQDLIWREARADFLAFALTGQSNIVFPEGIEFLLGRKDGSYYNRKITLVRSLSNPTIEDADEIWPYLGFYHYNSQVISSVLYEMSNEFGLMRAIEFVKWMDNQRGSEVIPLLAPPKPKPNGSISAPDMPPNTEYVKTEKISIVRAAIVERLQKIGKLVRKWMNQSTLSTNEKAKLESVLTAKKI